MSIHEFDPSQHFTAAFWDERYGTGDRVWSGNPNRRVVEVVEAMTTAREDAGTPPGRALDVGCGEGADAIWLAERGWETTGADVSQRGLDKARVHALERGVDDRTTWARVDLVAGDPLPGGQDLVTCAFLHLPSPHLEHAYAAVAAATVTGGTFVVVAHHPHDARTGLRNPGLAALLLSPERVVEALEEVGGWEVRQADAPTREQNDADGRAVTVTDTVVVAVRR